MRAKPSQLRAGEVKKQIASSESEVERRNLSVALEKKYTTLLLPFIMALFAAPFALSLSRKGNVVTVGYSIGLWLLFTGTNSVFEQLGLNGPLSPTLAVWSPLVIFSMFGVYLLTKVRT
ncbi:MAG: LptF/LptG family permease [Chloracidobacterium sp.]|nr:LptF/LptG family permease [Chloracidobacterium sp.]